MSNNDTKMVSMEDLLTETGASTNPELDLSGTTAHEFDEELDSPIPYQQYLAKFHDIEGHPDLEERETSVVSGVHFNTVREMNTYLEDGFEKISVDTQNELVNGKVRIKATKELTDRPAVVYTLEQKKQSLLSKIDSYSQKQYVSGFAFEVEKGNEETKAWFDTTDEDQSNFQTMYAASKSPDFETDPTYQGHIPMRGIPYDVYVSQSEISTQSGEEMTTQDWNALKQMYYFDAATMQRFMDDLARNIGTIKVTGWTLQNQVNTATEESFDQVQAAVYEAIGYEEPVEEGN